MLGTARYRVAPAELSSLSFRQFSGPPTLWRGQASDRKLHSARRRAQFCPPAVPKPYDCTPNKVPVHIGMGEMR